MCGCNSLICRRNQLICRFKSLICKFREETANTGGKSAKPAAICDRIERYLQSSYLEPMAEAGELQRLRPQDAAHAQQIYAATPDSPRTPDAD